ncbi:MAG: DUF748 domain-containing protein, partial [Halioglobus sp.]|nr:DUF748 domain-containing protein [Halioglobus sp.]
MRTALRALAIILAAYYVITLLIITPALNILPGWYVDKTWGRTLDTRWVILNPFKLSLDIASASLSEPNGERFLDIGESSVNLSLASLWHTGVVLDELRVHDLYAHLVREGEARFNFSDLLPAEEAAQPQADGGPPPGITIHLLNITSEAIVLNDQTREVPYRSEWTGLSLNVQELSTVLEEGKPYRLQVSGPNGGSLSWEGTLSLPGQFTEGSFTLQDIHLPSLWQAAEPWLVFEVQEGRLALAADYRVSWKEPLAYRLEGGRFGLTGVAIAPRDAAALPDTGIALDSLAIEGIEVDSDTLSATVGAVTLEGLVADGFSEGSQISLADMLLGPADPNEPVTAEPPPDKEDAAAPQWQASVALLQISDSAVNWRSPYTEPALIAVTPIAATASNLRWPLGGTLPFELTLAINETAGLEVQGQVDTDSGQAEIDYALSALPLAWFNPNLPEALKATIMSGEAALQGSVTLQDFAPATVALDAAITDFATRQQDVETHFTRWK